MIGRLFAYELELRQFQVDNLPRGCFHKSLYWCDISHRVPERTHKKNKKKRKTVALFFYV